MAKLKKTYDFKHAVLFLENGEGTIIEYDKDGITELNKYSLQPLLEEIASMGFVDFAINSTGVPASLDDEQDLNAFEESSDFYTED